MADYTKMWQSLGLDLKAHDQLLEILGKAYQDIYLSQKDRPEGMKYFDFVISEVHGLRIQELLEHKEKGGKVVGTFCTYVPEEIILALNGISVGLCAGAEMGFAEAEKYLPRNTCSLVKSALGFKLSKVCPYVESSDVVVGENTCDGKKKTYDVMKNFIKNFYVIDLPQVKSNEGKKYLKEEYQKFAEYLEKICGKKLEVDSLKNAIKIVNNKRKAVERLSLLRKNSPVPISGLDSLLINQIFFYDNPVRFTESVNKLCDELEDRVKKSMGVFDKSRTRILFSGCPMAIPNWKMHWLAETSKSVIVGEESCVGERGTRNIVSEDGKSVDDLLNNITDRYFKIDCSIFNSNESRYEHIKEMYKKYNAKGVIHYNLQFCQPYQIESIDFANRLEKEGIPTLVLDTDYSMEDVGQLKTRMEAFIERIEG